MGRKFSGLALAFFMMFAVVVNAGGEETKPQATPEVKGEVKTEAKPVTSLEDIKNLLGLNIYLQGGYTYNFVNPDSGTNEQRLFDKKANTFLLDLAQIQFAKEAADGRTWIQGEG